jgi:hypothetical protein
MDIASLILIPIGLLISIVSAAIGIGGGSLLVPLFHLAYSLEMRFAVGSASLGVLALGMFGSLKYYRSGYISKKLGLLVASTVIPASMLGAYLTVIINSEVLAFIFSIVLFYAAIRMFILRIPEEGATDTSIHNVHWKYIPIYLVIGVLSGMLGIGGGAMLIPVFILIQRIHTRIAIATSTLIILFRTLFTVPVYYMVNNIIFEYAIPIMIGMGIGAYMGAFISVRTRTPILRKIFGLFLGFISLRMAYPLIINILSFII